MELYACVRRFTRKEGMLNGLKTLIKKFITPALSIDYQALGPHDGPTNMHIRSYLIILLTEVRDMCSFNLLV